MAGSSIWAPVGDKGPTGDQGPPGPEGPQGPQGAPGPDAAAFNAFVLALQADGGDSLVGHIAGATVQQKFTQLDNQIAALGGGGQVAALANITALRALANPVGGAPTLAATKGYYAQGDAGAGFYYYDAVDTTSADNGGTIIVATAGGRWKLLHDGTVHVEQFGAKPDNLTDIRAQLNAALSVAAIRQIDFGAGPYLMANGNTIPVNSKTLKGIDGYGTYIRIVGLVTIPMQTNSWISGFTFECTSQTAGGWLFLLNTGAQSMEYITIKDIRTYNAKGFLLDDASASNIATNVHISDISMRLHKGPGLQLNDVFAFLECKNIAVDYVGNPVAQNFTAFSITSNQGSLFDNCEVSGGQVGSVAGVTAAQIGFSFNSSQAVYMRRCFSDTLGGRGCIFNGCQYVRLEMCTFGLNNDVGLALLSSTDIQVTNLYLQGRKGLGTAAAGIPGLFINGCVRWSVNAFNIQNCTGDGINTAASSTQGQLSNGSSTSNTGRGLVTNAGSISITSNVLFAGNTAGNYFLSTAFDHLTGCQGNSGAVLNVTGPASA
jgi:hypothetical protein